MMKGTAAHILRRAGVLLLVAASAVFLLPASVAGQGQPAPGLAAAMPAATGTARLAGRLPIRPADIAAPAQPVIPDPYYPRLFDPPSARAAAAISFQPLRQHHQAALASAADFHSPRSPDKKTKSWTPR